jgi:pimeloyl-ACP methyl ester carboxylesterase
LGNHPRVARYGPDLWTYEFAYLNRAGEADIQSDLFYDYRTNVAAYPAWQAWLARDSTSNSCVRGKYDQSFNISRLEAYRRDLPNAVVRILEAGHFALDTAADEIALYIREFIR